MEKALYLVYMVYVVGLIGIFFVDSWKNRLIFALVVLGSLGMYVFLSVQ